MQVFIRGHNSAHASQRTYLFSLLDYDNPRKYKSGITFASGDVKLILPGSTPANIDVGQIEERGTTGVYEITLTQSEQNHGGGAILFADQNDPPVWVAESFVCDWWGSAPTAATVPVDILGDGVGSLLKVDATKVGSVEAARWGFALDEILHAEIDNSTVTATATLARFTTLGGGPPTLDGGLVRRPLVFIPTVGGGDLRGFVTRILSHTQATNEITYTALPQAPEDGDQFLVLV